MTIKCRSKKVATRVDDALNGWSPLASLKTLEIYLPYAGDNIIDVE
jgi:hypothetical protein